METETILTLTEQEQDRLEKIEDKKNSGIFEVAFCGHFSAGKSTLLNALLGAEVLPTSPIPTSANIIKISKGDFGLQLIGPKNKKIHSYEGELPWSRINEWGKEGEQIKELHIQAPLSFLSDNGVIVDTPGVDSTDPTHAKVTAEQLYSTDTIVYVMDYNHVQSETNLHFLKQLSQAGKPIFIVINQIDKHEEKEVSLEDFRAQVDEIFEKWHIRYAGFYLTTMKEQDHPLNQFPALRQKMKAILKQSNQFMLPAQEALKKGYYEALTARIQSEFNEKRKEIKENAGKAGFTAAEVEEISTIKEQMSELKGYERALEQDYDDQLKRLYDNVHLFPFTTTELLERYVESKQRTFKVGVLFSGKKTKEEQEKRLNQLTVELNDNLKSQLIYYVEDYFRKVPVQKLSNQEEFLQAMKALDIAVSSDWIDGHITSASTNREYVYTLSKKMNEALVRDVRQAGSQLLLLYIEGLKQHVDSQIKELDKKQEKLADLEKYHEELAAISEMEKEMLHTAEVYKPSGAVIKPLEDLLEKVSPDTQVKEETFWKDITLEQENTEATPEETENIYNASSPKLDQQAASEWLQDLTAWTAPIKKHILFKEEVQELEKAVENYEKSTFTISLFGAFSAGKSSFANALLGAEVMPVSPHPTTATINTVRCADETHSHGEAVIYFKTRTALSEEIESVAKSIRQKVDIDTIAKWSAASLTRLTRQQRTLVDYLLMLQASLRDNKELLGTVKTVNMDNLSPYVADETMACLIQNVTMYYNSPLTEQGIILVDTPGVNSIHGRHTNIAFRQMETSDAIFYLTYYNHAFSKADQYFLQQLNSVNESFSANKMYFVINASDLADSASELQMVRKHVKEQLQQNGFSVPKLYDVSSKLALQPGSEDKSFEIFENHFYSAVLDELKRLGIEIIKEQESRVAEQLHNYSAYLQESSEERAAHLGNLKESAGEAIKDVKQQSFQYVVRDAQRELEQLSLHLRKRMNYVLSDYYLEAVNVSVLSGDNKKNLQMDLIHAVLDWAAMGEQFLKQEWEAVSIRLDHAVQRLFRNWSNTYEENLQKQIPDLYIIRPAFQLNIRTKMEDIKLVENEEKYKSYLKSKKDFFEGNKSKELKEALVQEAMENVTLLLQRKELEIKDFLEEAVGEITEETRAAFIHALEREIEKYDALMSEEQKEVIEQRKQAHQELAAYPL